MDRQDLHRGTFPAYWLPGEQAHACGQFPVSKDPKATRPISHLPSPPIAPRCRSLHFGRGAGRPRGPASCGRDHWTERQLQSRSPAAVDLDVPVEMIRNAPKRRPRTRRLATGPIQKDGLVECEPDCSEIPPPSWGRTCAASPLVCLCLLCAPSSTTLNTRERR